MSECYLYIMATNSGIYKIGISHNPKQRFHSIKTSSPEPVKLLFAIGCQSENKAREFESRLHHDLIEYVSNGEWFKVDKGKLAIALFDVLVESEFFGEHHDGIQSQQRTPHHSNVQGILDEVMTHFEDDKAFIDDIRSRTKNIDEILENMTRIASHDKTHPQVKAIYDEAERALKEMPHVPIDDYYNYCKEHGIASIQMSRELADEIVSRN